MKQLCKIALPTMLAIVFLSLQTFAQHTINDILDSTTVHNLLVISKKYGAVSFSGYMQPQFQYAQTNGTPAEFQGGNFGDNTNNRFRLRRGRLRADYMLENEDRTPSTYFVFQFDGTEQGVNVRDFWGRYYEHALQMFHFTIGLSGRPFGSELQISSSNRESPERGRMSQTLMKTERDLGITLSFNPRKKGAKLHNIIFDAGIYNGQGLAGPAEFDNSKDLIFRLSHKPYSFKRVPLTLSGGISTLQGGLNHQLPTKYEMQRINGVWTMTKDSASRYVNTVSPRKYYGADLQLSTKNESWKTELRLEYIFGQQTGTASNSSTPGSYPVSKNNEKLPYYLRSFGGAYATLIQTLHRSDTKMILKYDYYDPNRHIAGMDVTAAKGFTAADVRFDTFGLGVLHIFNTHLKAVVYYDKIINEQTAIEGYRNDRKDDILTIRTQFSF